MDNQWTTEVYNRSVYNDKYRWIHSTNEYGLWHDGSDHANKRWFFGVVGNTYGTFRTGLVLSWSDEKTRCPDYATDWKPGNDNVVSCRKLLEDVVNHNSDLKFNLITCFPHAT